MKRILDLLLVLLFTFIFALPILVVAIAVRLTSFGPALYWSSRVGKDGKLFWMPKFRTMKVGTPAIATHLLNSSDRYLTPVGSFLRESSLDELPQLWNVLTGDISLIGPRPELPSGVAIYDKEIPYYNIRHLIKPGLSGWAQINQQKVPHHGVGVEETKIKLSYDLF